jgi:hypothetical protein
MYSTASIDANPSIDTEPFLIEYGAGECFKIWRSGRGWIAIVMSFAETIFFSGRERYPLIAKCDSAEIET